MMNQHSDFEQPTTLDSLLEKVYLSDPTRLEKITDQGRYRRTPCSEPCPICALRSKEPEPEPELVVARG